MRRRRQLGEQWDRQVTCERCKKPRNDKGPVVEYRFRGGFRDMHAVCWQNFLDENEGKA